MAFGERKLVRKVGTPIRIFKPRPPREPYEPVYRITEGKGCRIKLVPIEPAKKKP